MKQNDLIDALKFAVERLDKESSEYIDECINAKKHSFDILVGMYFAIDSLNNSLVAYFGDDEIAKAVGTDNLVAKIEKGFKKNR